MKLHDIPSTSMIPLSERSEWQDVTPLKTVKTIIASPAMCQEMQELLDYFWTRVEANECSLRMLRLTEEIILQFNAAHYSVWEWRWRCLQHLGISTSALLERERAFMNRIAEENPKNYQLWNYRRKWAFARGKEHAIDEMEFSAACLQQDAKNYHAWAHRQAILLAFGQPLWDEELEFTSVLLDQDPRNNSAWNQRLFVVQQTKTEDAPFVLSKLAQVPHNDAAWVYALLACQRTTPLAHTAMTAVQRDPENIGALRTLADCCEKMAFRERKPTDQAKHIVLSLFSRLRTVDSIREGYWKYRMESFTGQLEE